MKKFLLMLAILGSVVTTASAENKQQPENDFVIIAFQGYETILYEIAANYQCDELLKAGLL